MRPAGRAGLVIPAVKHNLAEGSSENGSATGFLSEKELIEEECFFVDFFLFVLPESNTQMFGVFIIHYRF